MLLYTLLRNNVMVDAYYSFQVSQVIDSDMVSQCGKYRSVSLHLLQSMSKRRLSFEDESEDENNESEFCNSLIHLS